MVIKFFDDGIMPGGGGKNDTDIVLIPKGNNPICLKDYWSISLCNVIHKVISKCLVTQLRPFLDEIIPEIQSAFIPGRMITNNSIIGLNASTKSNIAGILKTPTVHVSLTSPKPMTWCIGVSWNGPSAS